MNALVKDTNRMSKKRKNIYDRNWNFHVKGERITCGLRAYQRRHKASKDDIKQAKKT